MEVRPGYRQTAVGVFPDDWEEKLLSSLVTTGPKNGYSGRSSKGARGTPTLTLGATTSGSLVLNDETVKRLEETLDPNSELFLEPGDILVQRSNTLDLVGTTAVFDGPSGVYIYPDLMMRMRFREEATAHWFWRHANSANGRRFFRAVAAGSSGTMPKIGGDRLRRMLVPVPALPEQRAIATALSDVDALLGGLDRLIAKKRDIKQAAMQQLLTGQTRLAGFHGEWEASTVGREFEIELGKMLDAEKNVGVPKPYLGNRAVQWGRIDISDLPTVRMTQADMERFRLRRGDLLVCEGGEVGRAAIWDAPIDECYYQKALHRLRRRRDFDPRLMAGFLGLWGERGTLSNYVTQTSIAHLPREKFMEVPLPVPPAAEQRAIAAVLSDMDAELAALEARRDKTRALKQAMMQELLTGKTRLVPHDATRTEVKA